MRIDFSQFGKPPVLDYAPPPAPRTLADWLSDLRQGVEKFGGLTFVMFIGGLSLMAIGMMIGSSDEAGMAIFAIGFAVLGLLLSVWTIT